MVSEAVLNAAVGRMRHLGDITKIDGRTAPWVDCIIGGSPCQDLSIAGKRAGLAGARSGLFMEQIRLVKEMREASGAAYPRFMVWENVPGAFSSNKGQDFAAVLEETIRIVEPEAPDIEVPDKGWPTWGGVATWTDDGVLLGELSTLNTGECPSVVVESRLSQILEAAPLPKYCLSAKACLGILRRAERRGKDLPEKLKAALLTHS